MSENFTDIHKLIQDSQTLIAWKAPLRPYKRKGKKTLRFFLAVAFLLSVIIFFFGDPILLLPVWAGVFLFYILTITPPPLIESKITKFGVETAGVTMRWEVLDYFFFTERWGYDVLTLVTHAPYRFQAYIVLPDKETKRKVATFLGEHLMFESKPLRTLSDRLVDILAYLIPDDDDEEKPAHAEAKKPKLSVA